MKVLNLAAMAARRVVKYGRHGAKRLGVWRDHRGKQARRLRHVCGRRLTVLRNDVMAWRLPQLPVLPRRPPRARFNFRRWRKAMRRKLHVFWYGALPVSCLSRRVHAMISVTSM